MADTFSLSAFRTWTLNAAAPGGNAEAIQMRPHCACSHATHMRLTCDPHMDTERPWQDSSLQPLLKVDQCRIHWATGSVVASQYAHCACCTMQMNACSNMLRQRGDSNPCGQSPMDF